MRPRSTPTRARCAWPRRSPPRSAATAVAAAPSEERRTRPCAEPPGPRRDRPRPSEVSSIGTRWPDTTLRNATPTAVADRLQVDHLVAVRRGQPDVDAFAFGQRAHQRRGDGQHVGARYASHAPGSARPAPAGRPAARHPCCSMPAPTRVCVRRLTVARDSPVRSASSPLPSRSEPGRKARRISMPRSSERLAGDRPGLSAMAARSSAAWRCRRLPYARVPFPLVGNRGSVFASLSPMLRLRPMRCATCAHSHRGPRSALTSGDKHVQRLPPRCGSRAASLAPPLALAATCRRRGLSRQARSAWSCPSPRAAVPT